MAENDLVLKRAQAAVLSRDFALAARLYKTLLKTEPGNVKLLGELGALYVKAGEDNKALPYYEQILMFSKDDFDALNSMGGVYRRLKRYDDSIRVLQQALDTGKNAAEVNYNLGFTYKLMGNYDDAIECFESVIEDNPSDVLAYNHLGAIYALRKDHQRAVAAYKRGLQIDPNHPVLQLNLAKSFVALHNDSDAAAAYEAALRAKPGWLDAIRDYTNLLVREHKTKDAAALVKKSILLYPKDVGIQNLLGRIYLKQFDFPEAVHTFEKARKIDDKNTQTLSGLAEAYEKGDKPADAVNVLKTAESAEPENTGIKKQMAHALLSANEYESAESKIKDLYDKNGNDVQILDLFGQYYICRKDNDKADLYFKKIEKLDPTYIDYCREAAGRFKQTGQLENAEQYIIKYLQTKKNDPAGFIALAGINEAAGNTVAALENYHKALKYDQYNVLAKNEAQRLGNAVNEQNRLQRETESALAENADELEIVMDAPEETSGEEQQENKEPEVVEEAPFDFDSFGENLKDDEVSTEDALDMKTDDEEALPSLDDLIPEGGSAESEEEESEDETEEKDNQENEASGQNAVSSSSPSSPIVSDEENNAAESAGTNADASLSDDESAEPAMPEENSADAEEQNTDDEEKEDNSEQPAAKTELSDDAVAKITETMKRVSEEAQKAIEAAQKSWDAAQKAADAAQSADSAEQHINELADAVSPKAENSTENEIAEPEQQTVAADENDLPAEEDVSQEDAVNQQDFRNLPQQDIPPTENDSDNIKDAASYSDFSSPSVRQSAVLPNIALSPDAAARTTQAYGNLIDEVSGMLPMVEKMLENRENAKKFMPALELFKKLQTLSGYLPETQKNAFRTSRTRLLLDYVIARLSGKPGLLVTAKTLRKAGLKIEGSEEISAAVEKMSEIELLETVLSDMRAMTHHLEDGQLGKALDDSADDVMKKL